MLTLYVAATPSAPDTPAKTLVFLDDYSKNNVAIQVSWEAPTDNGAPVTGYQLWMSEEAYAFELVYDGPGRADILTYTVLDGITKRRNYRFKVRAMNDVGIGEFSPELTSLAAVAPSTPLNFAFVTSGTGTIDLRWDPPMYDGGSVLTGYFVYYRIAGADTWEKTSIISSVLNELQLGSLTANQEYTMKIVAVNVRGESERSGIIYQYAGAVASDLTIPEEVPNTRTLSSIGIKFFAPGVSTTPPIGYQLFVNDVDSNGIPTNLIYDGSSISSVLQTTAYELRSGHSYWFAYRVLNYAGWSELSPFFQMIAGKLPQPPAQTPYQIAVSPDEVTFGWVPTSDVGGATKLENYKIYDGDNLLDTVSKDTLEYTYDGVTAGDSLSITISAVTLIGEGNKSNPLTIWAIDVPVAPTLTLTDTNRNSCSVEWTPVTAPTNSLITGYVVMVDDGFDGDFVDAYDGRTNPSQFN